MSSLFQLWLPILVTAALVFIASSLIHMVFKWHNSDYKKLPNEDDVRAVLRAGALVPGQYVLPHCVDMKAMQNDGMRQKYIDGPIGFLTVKQNGVPSMGSALMLWFVFNIVVASVAAGVALQAYTLKGDVNQIAHIVGILSFVAYAGGGVQAGIWMGKPWGSVAKDLLDGLIYAIVSALTFMWLWP